MAYAENTTVDSTKSRAEIERTLERYGANSFGYATQPGRAVVQFEMENRHVRFVVPLPDRDDKRFTLTPTGRKASPDQVSAKYEQAVRQKWRALALVVKAKLEAVEAGISVFEQEFLANIIMPGGKTVYENVQGGIEQAYQSGKVSQLLAVDS